MVVVVEVGLVVVCRKEGSDNGKTQRTEGRMMGRGFGGRAPEERVLGVPEELDGLV